MTVAGDEQCSLLMLQCELTVLSQPRVPYCMKEGKIPVLIWLSTPYLHCTCTLKGWKNLAENKEKKDAALKMEEAAVSLSGQTGEGFATCRGNKAKPHSSVLAVGVMETATLRLNRTTLTTCGYFLYNQGKPFSSGGSTSGSCSGVCALKMCKHFVTVEHRFPRKLLLQNFKTKKPGNTFSAESCRTGKALLESLLKQEGT